MKTPLRPWLATASTALLAVWLATPMTAHAKTHRMKSCAKAEAAFLATGVGDSDGDGLSDCREVKQLGTDPHNTDTDGDGVSDAQEISMHTDPSDADTDGDGMNDPDDPAPRIQQRLLVFVDALTCPATGVPGTLMALGATITLDDTTVFEDGTCADLAAMIAAAPAGTQIFAKVNVVEDSNGFAVATEVEAETPDED
jgi:hypothetical protein